MSLSEKEEWEKDREDMALKYEDNDDTASAESEELPTYSTEGVRRGSGYQPSGVRDESTSVYETCPEYREYSRNYALYNAPNEVSQQSLRVGTPMTQQSSTSVVPVSHNRSIATTDTSQYGLEPLCVENYIPPFRKASYLVELQCPPYLQEKFTEAKALCKRDSKLKAKLDAYEEEEEIDRQIFCRKIDAHLEMIRAEIRVDREQAELYEKLGKSVVGLYRVEENRTRLAIQKYDNDNEKNKAEYEYLLQLCKKQDLTTEQQSRFECLGYRLGRMLC